MQSPFAERKSVRKPLAHVVMVCSLLLAGCFFEKPPEPRAQGSTLAALDKLAKKPHAKTGPILTADLDKMSTSGEAYFEDRFLHANMENHLAHPLGQVTLRVVLTRGGKMIRGDTTFVRDLLVAPHSKFQVTVKVKRQPRRDEAWAWALVDGNEGEDPR
jgi:hypothetical protein